jgi:hypothetical protein
MEHWKLAHRVGDFVEQDTALAGQGLAEREIRALPTWGITDRVKKRKRKKVEKKKQTMDNHQQKRGKVRNQFARSKRG